MARYTVSLLLAVLVASVPYDAYGQSPEEECNCFDLRLNPVVSTRNGTFFAFGQETTALKAQNLLPHCYLSPCPVCKGKSLPNLTLEHITKPHFYFPAQTEPFIVKWDSATFPRLQPNHTGVYRCEAGNRTSEKTYNLSVVVPSRINCKKPEYPSERQVSVSCTVYGYPKPTVLWKGHTVPNITKSEPSYQHGVYECNSTAVFQLPDNLTDETSASISLEVFHIPPIKCTVVAGDSSIQERCNYASRNITESIAITPNCSVVSQELNRTYMASGQETEALKTHNVLPYCRKKHFGRCMGKTIHLTLRHTDEPQFNFTDPNVSNDVTWNSTRFPRLEPFHSGEYVCEADHEQFDLKYNLQVVVPARTDCQLRQDLVKKVVSVNCTVCGNPLPKARWEGKDVNFTDSQPSYRNGVHEYNSTAVFPLPGNWTYNSSVSVSIKVYHDPPFDCTAVKGDLSIQQRCNDTSSNISTTFAISPGITTVESRGIYDVLTKVTYLDPRVYGQQINNYGETSYSKDLYPNIVASCLAFLFGSSIGCICMCIVWYCLDKASFKAVFLEYAMREFRRWFGNRRLQNTGSKPQRNA